MFFYKQNENFTYLVLGIKIRKKECVDSLSIIYMFILQSKALINTELQLYFKDLRIAVCQDSVRHSKQCFFLLSLFTFTPSPLCVLCVSLPLSLILALTLSLSLFLFFSISLSIYLSLYIYTVCFCFVNKEKDCCITGEMRRSISVVQLYTL